MSLRQSKGKWRPAEVMLFAAPLLVVALTFGWSRVSNFLLPPPPPKVLKGHTARVYDCAFSLDGKTLATGSNDGTVKLWDTKTGILRRTLTGMSGQVKAVAFSGDGRYLLSGGWFSSPTATGTIAGGELELWDVNAGDLLWTRTLPGWRTAINRVAFAPDGKRFAAGMAMGDIAICDVTNGKVVRTLPGATGIFALAFAPHGNLLASNDKLWDLNTGHSLRKVGFPDETVAFSRDGHIFAIGRRGGTIELQETRTGKLLRQLRVPDASENSSVRIAFSSRSQLLSHSNTDVSLWNVKTGAVLRSIANDYAMGAEGAFSPNSKTFAHPSGDDVLLWRFLR